MDQSKKARASDAGESPAVHCAVRASRLVLPKEKVEWRWDVEFPTTFLVNEARSADLVVIPRTQVKINPYRFLDAAAAVLSMGRPTILVPEHVPELKAERILVGWKDTREARLAVRDALPFLSRATEVTVTEICSSDDQDRARLRVRDVAKYLQCHDAKCQIDVRVHWLNPTVTSLFVWPRSRAPI
jgi:hypothetical protein